MTGIAFFDDFTDTVLGHHPDFIVGLANAATEVTGGAEPVQLHCPTGYLSQHRLDERVAHHPAEGVSPGSGAVKLPYSRLVTPDNLAAASRSAAARGVTVFVDCYFDENYPAWPAPELGLRHVLSLHRPGYFTTGLTDRFPPRRPVADIIRGLAPAGLFVVHSPAAERLAAKFVDSRRLLRTGWPTATRAEVARWFGQAAAPPDEDPYVLSIGSARTDKGIDLLMSALPDGQRLRIVGQQYEETVARIGARHPRHRVEWETGWIPRERLNQAIAHAAVTVFPYQPEFSDYGGASGALAQALVMGKPVIVSEVLAEQVPVSPACRIVPVGDADALRHAIEDSLRRLPELRAAAAELRGHVERQHTYEAHVEHILERCA
ncbi:glycosyltransferase family 4 protein [Micromonospora sp. C51]|uniref:glycosyltransferase family 4 protein n=1 Tax=Micromonospora sp. C51 TaxID=2824879 RepID=UPI001B36C986|nr:glycosyltransferase family 4 protein [Micromonospora sp. C51]MBQ1053069.1 glycosyltransferase family 4 protein [Micromonospora sp. C51]